jgi:cytochrome c biogenesis protein CcmG, thiol:disulfide interchange protein DsbE
MLLSALLLVLIGCERGSVPALVGKAAPDFTIEDSSARISLRDFRGKVVVLNFWATWCPPCVEEMPSLVAMQKQMKDRVVVFAVSTDDSASDYDRFVRDHGLTPSLTVIRDPQKRSNALYGSFRFPETYVIDANGVLRRKFIGPVQWTSPEIVDYLSKL